MQQNHQNLQKGAKEARIGLDSEQDIIDRINKDEKFYNEIRSILIQLGFNAGAKIQARKNDIKTDIFIQINEQEEIGASIKSSEKTSFHQLDRRRLEHWKEILKMPDDVFEIIKASILRVSKNPRAKFILEEEQDKIKDFFLKYIPEIISEIFKRGEERLKLLIVINLQERRLYMFCMDEVIEFLSNDARDISFTDKGIIRLGRFITVQRKSGNGRHITIPKTEWSPSGNQLQFKFSPLKFAEYVKSKSPIKFGIVDY
jgi:hypothetical protein